MDYSKFKRKLGKHLSRKLTTDEADDLYDQYCLDVIFYTAENKIDKEWDPFIWWVEKYYTN